MREIKFRYIIQDGASIKKIFVKIEEAEKGFGISPDKKIIARSQFTGLLDKSGNEIFEDDVVGYYIGQRRVFREVKFEDSRWSICNFDSNKELTVYGNIYENPELLKS